MKAIKDIFTCIKRIIDVVGFFYSSLCVVGLISNIVVPFRITTSRTLRGYIVLFGLVGGFLGYFFTASGWAGKAKAKRIKRRNFYLMLFFFLMSIAIMIIVILNPNVARQFLCFKRIREFLLITMPLSNFIIGGGVGMGSYFLMGAITLSAPKIK